MFIVALISILLLTSSILFVYGSAYCIEHGFSLVQRYFIIFSTSGGAKATVGAHLCSGISLSSLLLVVPKQQWVLLIPEPVSSIHYANHIHMRPYLAGLYQGHITTFGPVNVHLLCLKKICFFCRCQRRQYSGIVPLYWIPFVAHSLFHFTYMSFEVCCP